MEASVNSDLTHIRLENTNRYRQSLLLALCFSKLLVPPIVLSSTWVSSFFSFPWTENVQ